MEDIYEILNSLEDTRKKVLATIIHVKGSSYKKEGSSMLFFDDESHIGHISAGCIEVDLAIKAQEVMKNQKPITIHFDMSKETDFDWGQGTGCNGIIAILLEPITLNLQRDLMLLKEHLAFNHSVLLLKKWNEKDEYLFIPSIGKPFGSWSGQISDKEIKLNLGESIQHTIFQHIYQPKPRLIIFGAGPDVRPLVSLASETGFSVTVSDWREDFCQKKYFPKADQLSIGFPRELVEKIIFSSYDFILIMSHDFQKDQEILLSLLDKEVKYVGLLGPKERTKRLLKQKKRPNWLSSPVGLSIGAKGSVEIAVSIVAEMIDKWRKSIGVSND